MQFLHFDVAILILIFSINDCGSLVNLSISQSRVYILHATYYIHKYICIMYT